MTDAMDAVIADAVRWTRDKALPLWADVGFDHAMGGFHEQLTFGRTPVLTVPRRAMVQARQISVFAHASLLGWFPEGGSLAITAADTLIERFAREGGAAGFCFAVDLRDGSVDDRFDLYAHAFALFALAWAMRLDAKPLYRRTVDLTLGYLDNRHHDPAAGGYWDQEPRPDGYRRQNPHMHMFEALLELYEVTGDAVFLDRLATLRELCEHRFCDTPGKVVHELYDDAWTVASPLVEPGHQMEWSWLLCRHDARLGQRSEFADRLFEHAVAHGLDPRTGRVLDEITASGETIRASSRSWPHTETVKAIVTQHERGRAGCPELLVAVLGRLRAVYARDDLGGGWVDHVDAEDRPTSAIMPASTLYHIFLAVAEAARLSGAGKAADHGA